VLERVHRSRIYIQIRVEFLHRDAKSTCFQEVAKAGRGEAFAERRCHAPGDEEVLGFRLGIPRHIHGRPDYCAKSPARADVRGAAMSRSVRATSRSSCA